MSQKENLLVISSIFAFLKDRHPLVLASMLSNAEDKDTIRFYYDKWIQRSLEEEAYTCKLCGHSIIDKDDKTT